MFVLEKHWWTLVSSWSDEFEKVGQPEKNVLKKIYKKTTDKLLDFVYNYDYFYFYLIQVYIVVYNSSSSFFI